jgi:hypothetical protein
MSTPTSLPRRMRLRLPENGYESPAPRDGILFGMGIQGNGERKRNGFATGNEEACAEVASPFFEPYTYGGTPEDQQSSDEEKGPMKAGFRDRVGCYTWTWFTMTMATGGIANVLHSSNDTRLNEVLL